MAGRGAGAAVKRQSVRPLANTVNRDASQKHTIRTDEGVRPAGCIATCWAARPCRYAVRLLFGVHATAVAAGCR